MELNQNSNIKDDNQTFSLKHQLSSDSDDEVLFAPKKKKLMFLAENDEMSVETEFRNRIPQVKDGDDTDESIKKMNMDEDIEAPATHCATDSGDGGKRKIKRARRLKVLDSSDEDEDDIKTLPMNGDLVDKSINSHSLYSVSRDTNKRKSTLLEKKRMMFEKLKVMSEKKKEQAEEPNELESDGKPRESQTQEAVEKPMNFDNNIFDAEDYEVDDALDNKSNGNHLNGSQSETETNPELVLPNGKKQLQKKKETKREKENAILEIHSENQRLLRQSSVKLPYYKAPKCSLEDFLTERRKSSTFPNKPKLSRADDSHLLLNTKSPSLRQNQLTNHISDVGMDGNKVQNFVIQTEFNASDIPTHPEHNQIVILISDLIQNVEDNINCCNLIVDCCEESTIVNEEYKNTILNGANAKEVMRSCVEYEAAIMEANNDKCPTEEDHDVIIPLCHRIKAMESKDSNDTNIEDTSTINSEFAVMKQKILESVKALKPCLSGPENGIIFFDDNASKDHVKSELEIFVDKFVSHTKQNIKKRAMQDVKLNIVSKSGLDADLVVSNIHMNVPAVEIESTFDKPGEKFSKLKTQLLQKILEKKKAKIENQQIIESIDENEILPEEEADLTDRSDTESSDDQADSEGEETDEDTVVLCHKKRKKSLFIDDEASESQEVAKENSDVSDSDTKTSKSSHGSQYSFSGIFTKAKLNEDQESKDHIAETQSDAQKCNKRRLLYYDSDSEDTAKVTSLVNVSSSFDITSSAYQPNSGFNEANTNSSVHDTSERTDLRIKDNDVPLSQMYSSQPLWSSQNSNKNEDEVIMTTPNLAGFVSDNSPSGEALDKLLPLCSGIFPDSQFKIPPSVGSCCGKSESSSSISSQSQPLKDGFLESYSKRFFLGNTDSSGVMSLLDMFGPAPSSKFQSSDEKSDISPAVKDLCFTSSQPDICDLVGLCSGTFTTRSDQSEKDEENEDDSDEDSNTFLGSKSKVENALNCEPEDKDVFDNFNTIDENSIGSHNSEEEKDSEVDDNNTDAKEKKVKVNDFFEDEAELSGSDVGSEAEEDELDEEDYLADLIGDEDLPSEEVLRDQIGRVHMKKLMDEDKRQLKLYQELYFEDGDLHNDGPGRQRKFTWRNSDIHQFGNDADRNSDSDKEELPEEEKWRVERHERETWLKEQESENLLNDDSPLKMKNHTSVKISIPGKVKGTVVSKTNVNLPGAEKFKFAEKLPSGSYLARGHNYLSDLAKKMKRADRDAAGSRTTKHFVFRAVSPNKSGAKQDSRANSLMSAKPTTPRIFRNINKPVTKKRNSVFDLMDRS